jgi:hypothetical protein
MLKAGRAYHAAKAKRNSWPKVRWLTDRRGSRHLCLDACCIAFGQRLLWVALWQRLLRIGQCQLVVASLLGAARGVTRWCIFVWGGKGGLTRESGSQSCMGRFGPILKL